MNIQIKKDTIKLLTGFLRRLKYKLKIWFSNVDDYGEPEYFIYEEEEHKK